MLVLFFPPAGPGAGDSNHGESRLALLGASACAGLVACECTDLSAAMWRSSAQPTPASHSCEVFRHVRWDAVDVVDDADARGHEGRRAVVARGRQHSHPECRQSRDERSGLHRVCVCALPAALVILVLVANKESLWAFFGRLTSGRAQPLTGPPSHVPAPTSKPPPPPPPPSWPPPPLLPRPPPPAPLPVPIAPGPAPPPLTLADRLNQRFHRGANRSASTKFDGVAIHWFDDWRCGGSRSSWTAPTFDLKSCTFSSTFLNAHMCECSPPIARTAT